MTFQSTPPRTSVPRPPTHPRLVSPHPTQYHTPPFPPSPPSPLPPALPLANPPNLSFLPSISRSFITASRSFSGNPHHSLRNRSCSIARRAFLSRCRCRSIRPANHSSRAASCSAGVACSFMQLFMARCWSRQAKDTVKVRFRAQAANAVRERGLVGWGRGGGGEGGKCLLFRPNSVGGRGHKRRRERRLLGWRRGGWGLTRGVEGQRGWRRAGPRGVVMVVRGPWFGCELVVLDDVGRSFSGPVGRRRGRAAGAEISTGWDVNCECTVPRVDLGG